MLIAGAVFDNGRVVHHYDHRYEVAERLVTEKVLETGKLLFADFPSYDDPCVTVGDTLDIAEKWRIHRPGEPLLWRAPLRVSLVLTERLPDGFMVRVLEDWFFHECVTYEAQFDTCKPGEPVFGTRWWRSDRTLSARYGP